MSFLRWIVLLVVLVALCVGVYFLVIWALSDTGVPQQTGHCPTLYTKSNATWEQFAKSSPYFVKYYTSSNQSTYPAYSSNDGHKCTLTRNGTSAAYNFSMTTFDNNGNKHITDTVYTVDESTQKVNKYGVWQRYWIVSFKSNAYALLYFCIPKDDGYELYRSLMTTDLKNDLTVPLQEDASHNFTQPLFEFPFKYKDQY